MANLGVVAALLEADDVCVQDKLNHASLIDAARLAGCELKRYPHGDVDGARRQLESRPDAAALLASDGVFSMDGDVAPLRALASACADEQALLMIDDAHGLGVLGPRRRRQRRRSGPDAGRRTDPDGDARQGARCRRRVRRRQRGADRRARAEGAHVHLYDRDAAGARRGARAAVDVARFEGWRRDRLAQLIAHFRAGAAARGLTLGASRTPIQPIIIGTSEAALAASAKLEEAGFYVPAIRPPTVPEGKARLRIALTALHSESDVERLLAALATALA